MKNWVKKLLIAILVLATFATCVSCSVNTENPQETANKEEEEQKKMEQYKTELPEAEKQAATAARTAYQQLLAECNLTEEQLEVSQISEGNSKRVEDIIKKSLLGESITLGILGDSIPSGAGASETSKTLGMRIFDFWNNNFHPMGVEGNAELVNASIGSNSLTNVCFRMDDDLMSRNPDIVFYSVWCTHDAVYDKAAFESTVARILKAGCALVVVVVTAENGANNTGLFKSIAEYYQVPFVSWAAAFKEASFKWSEFGSDSIHPNDRGHGGIAASANLYLTKVAEKLAAGTETAEDAAFPEEASFNKGWFFINGTVYDRNDLDKFTVEKGTGWSDTDMQFSQYRTYAGWTASAGAEPIVFTVDVTTGVMILFAHHTDIGTAYYIVEDAETGKKISSGSIDNYASFLYSWNTGFVNSITPKKVKISVTPQTKNTTILGILVA